MAKNLIVLVVPTETGNGIDQRSSMDEVLACPETIRYGIGDYFQAQNDDELGMHWSFLYDDDKNEELTGSDLR